MPPFLTGRLIQFPDYERLRLLLPKIETHGRSLTDNYFVYEVEQEAIVRDFIARFRIKPFVAFISRFPGGEELTPHRDDRSTVKLHYPIETDDCEIRFYEDGPQSALTAAYLYRRETPVLLDVQVLHRLVNRSAHPKYSLIFSWDSLDLDSAAKMLASGLA